MKLKMSLLALAATGLTASVALAQAPVTVRHANRQGRAYVGAATQPLGVTVASDTKVRRGHYETTLAPFVAGDRVAVYARVWPSRPRPRGHPGARRGQDQGPRGESRVASCGSRASK
jgi:hypothetical protein